eukprot:GGOE01001818.1.p4 GENE.GGOE01001818.1~~GGOE01001818.1.p4  ORF type:complete len:131 (+),score=48.37 GGOE01001818.1:756-1148(+)
MYPMVLVFCWTVASVHRILNLFSDDDGDVYPFFLFALHFTLCKLQGLFNAVVYGCDPHLFRDLKRKWHGATSTWDPQRDDAELPEMVGGQWPATLPPVGAAEIGGAQDQEVTEKEALTNAEEHEFQEVQL